MTSTLRKEFKGQAFALPTQAKYLEVKSVEVSLQKELKELQAEEHQKTLQEDKKLSFNEAFAIAMSDVTAESTTSSVTNSFMMDMVAPGIGGASTALFEVFDAVSELSNAKGVDAIMDAAITLADERKSKLAWKKKLEAQYAAKAKEQGVELLDRNTKHGVMQRRMMLEDTLDNLNYASKLGLTKVEVSDNGVQIPSNYLKSKAIYDRSPKQALSSEWKSNRRIAA
ncbi:MAG: hypothetical protein CMP22_05910 [Rickettsiales bacterium]|nr:hypothetical protein [Rickettsiales bacterium]